MFSQGGGITQTKSEIDNQHRCLFLLIYTSLVLSTSVKHAQLARGKCLMPSPRMTNDFRSPWSVTDVSPRRQAVLATDRHSDRCITTVGFPCTPRSASQRIICLQRDSVSLLFTVAVAVGSTVSVAVAIVSVAVALPWPLRCRSRCNRLSCCVALTSPLPQSRPWQRGRVWAYSMTSF